MELCEALRRTRLIELGRESADRATLEQRHGRVWSPAELRQEFKVVGYLAPFVVVRRDGVLGSLEFQPSPRFYFNWRPDHED